MTIFWRWPIWRTLCSGGLSLPLCLAGSLLLSLLAPLAVAGDTQPLDSIVAAATEASEARAMAHGYDNVAVQVRPLDARLRLPACDEPLSSSISAATQVLGSVSVGIGCPGERAWTIYVRTKVTAQQSIPVLARPLGRGAVIGEDDLKFINQPLNSGANGMITDPGRIVGMQLTRALDAGAIVRVKHLKKPKIIKRGQLVTLYSGANGLEVRIQGKALSDAASGERVAVSNLSSGKRVEGIAQADGTVTVH